MDDLQKDLWELSDKYGLHIDHLRMKIEQMIMEMELAVQSGIAMIGYDDTIYIFGKDDKE